MTTTDTTDFTGNAKVIDLGPALAARCAGKEVPTNAKRISYTIELDAWPLDALRWFADHMEAAYAFDMAAQIRRDCDEAERVS